MRAFSFDLLPAADFFSGIYLSIMNRPMGGRTALPGMETLSMLSQPQPPFSELIRSRVQCTPT